MPNEMFCCKYLCGSWGPKAALDAEVARTPVHLLLLLHTLLLLLEHLPETESYQEPQMDEWLPTNWSSSYFDLTRARSRPFSTRPSREYST